MAALPFIAVGVVALLIVLAFSPVMRAASDSLAAAAEEGVPVIGGALGWLVSRWSSITFRAYAKVAGWAVSALGPLETAIFKPTFEVWRYFNANNASHVSIFQAMQRLQYVAIPKAIATANDYTNRLVAVAVDYATQLQAQEDQFVRRAVSAAVEYATALQAQEDQFVRALGATIVQYATALQAQEDQFVRFLYAQLSDFARSLFSQAIDHADQVGATSQSYAQALNREAIDYVDGQVKSVGGYVETVREQVIGYADQVGAQSSAYARDLVVPVVAAVTALEDSPCIKACNPLGEIGNLLQGIEDLALVELIFQMVVEGVRDPGGTARAVSDELTPILRGVGQDIGSMAGVQRAA